MTQEAGFVRSRLGKKRTVWHTSSDCWQLRPAKTIKKLQMPVIEIMGLKPCRWCGTC
jgi:hypothetical protein